MKSLAAAAQIEKRIYVIRNHKVIFDSDLAQLYGVPNKRLNEQVKRNSQRFPSDFMFQLSRAEFVNLKSQIATSSWGGRRKLPYVFTEHGALMAANVLNSTRAIQMSVIVIRAFVRLRDILESNKDLARKVLDLERKYSTHDSQIQEIFAALHELMEPRIKPRRRIGFKQENGDQNP